MKINTYKIINILLLVLVAGIAGYVSLYWNSVCTEGGCSFESMEGIYRPILWGSLALIPTLTILLFFSSRIFKYWFIGFFSWMLPLNIYFVSQVDIYSSSVLSVQRGELAWLLGSVFYILTIAFIFGSYLFLYWKKRIDRKELLYLLLLIPAAIVWYIIFKT